LPAVAEAFQVLVAALHEAAVDVLQPQARGEYEAQAYDYQHDVGHGFAQPHLEPGIEQQRHAEGGEGDDVLQSCAHVLAVGQLGVQVQRAAVVHGQLEEAAVDGSRREQGPGQAADDRQLARHHGGYHQHEGYQDGHAVEYVFGAQQRVDGLLAAHQAVYVVAFVAHDAEQEHDAEDDVVVDHDEALHAGGVVDVAEAEHEAEGHDDEDDGAQRCLAHLVAQQHLELQAHVFAYLAVAVEEAVFGHVAHLDGGVFHLVHFVVDESAHDVAAEQPQQCDGQQRAQQCQWVAGDVAFAQSDGPEEEGTVVGDEQGAAYPSVEGQWQGYPPHAFVHQRAAQQKPVVVQYHQQPDADAVGQHAGYTIVAGDGDDGQWHEEEQPEEVERTQARAQQQEVYQPAAAYGQQQVGFHLLRGCLLEGKTDKEVDGQDDDEAPVDDVVGLAGFSFQGKGKGGAEEDEVAGPEGGHEIHPEAPEAVFVVHGVALVGQAAMSAEFEK